MGGKTFAEEAAEQNAYFVDFSTPQSSGVVCRMQNKQSDRIRFYRELVVAARNQTLQLLAVNNISTYKLINREGI